MKAKAVAMRVAAETNFEGTRYAVRFKCPGCGYSHVLPVRGWAANNGQAQWAFNGDFERPTLTPSILIRSGHYADGTPASECWLCKKYDSSEWPNHPCHVCHSFVTDGRIQFLGDCTHALAGQTVDLPELASDA